MKTFEYIIRYTIKKAEQKTQSFNDWLNNLGKEGYKLVHCEYLISEKGKLCILKRK